MITIYIIFYVAAWIYLKCSFGSTVSACPIFGKFNTVSMTLMSASSVGVGRTKTEMEDLSTGYIVNIIMKIILFFTYVFGAVEALNDYFISTASSALVVLFMTICCDNILRIISYILELKKTALNKEIKKKNKHLSKQERIKLTYILSQNDIYKYVWLNALWGVLIIASVFSLLTAIGIIPYMKYTKFLFAGTLALGALSSVSLVFDIRELIKALKFEAEVQDKLNLKS